MERAVIVVADAVEVVRQLQAMLLEERGATVLEAASAEEAMRLAVGSQPDAVLVNVSRQDERPDLALAERLRRHPATMGTRLLVVGDAPAESMGTICHDLDPDGYLSRPFSASQFVSAVERVLSLDGSLARFATA